jgi:hypothetical protein
MNPTRQGLLLWEIAHTQELPQATQKEAIASIFRKFRELDSVVKFCSGIVTRNC